MISHADIDYEDEGNAVCADGYPEHDAYDTYSGPDGTGWECRRCGAEGWEPAEEHTDA